MGTFSLNIGTTIEATNYPLHASFSFLLNEMQDNESKLISPHVLRDVTLSLLSSVAFKETVAFGSTIPYIGIDTLAGADNTINDFVDNGYAEDYIVSSVNNIDADVKLPIVIGKRSYSGTYSYSSSHDLMTSGLLTSDVDIFLYNTRIDTISNASTKVMILSGTNFGTFNSSPYFQSQVVSGVYLGITNSLSLDFINPYVNGDVNIGSSFSTISINTITFPGITESSASASNNRTLMYENGKLAWSDIVYPPVSYIGATGTITNIYGSPVNINGYPIELTDTRKIPITFGDVVSGSTFNNDAVSDVIKRMLYPYLAPLCSISILPPYSSGYVEVGTYPTPTIKYTITKRSLPTLMTSLTNMIPSIYPAITTPGQNVVTSTSNGVVISPITATATYFKITVNDNTQNNSATASLTGIYPYFYGFSSLSSMTSIGLAGLSKLVEYKYDKFLDITGTSSFYFVYDYDYGTLSNIYDSYGNTVSGSFSHTSAYFSSPTGLWASKQFYIYKSNTLGVVGPPSENFQFVY
jgi:hypothetical protein